MMTPEERACWRAQIVYAKKLIALDDAERELKAATYCLAEAEKDLEEAQKWYDEREKTL